MPSEVIRVARVTKDLRHVRDRSKTFPVFLIHADVEPGERSAPVYETTNQWIASACEGAWHEGRAIPIVWKDGPFGRVLVSVNLELGVHQ